MMKPANARRLALSTETLRSLSTSELAIVQGGGFASLRLASDCISCQKQVVTAACQNA